jgi:twitching motility protein PilT
MITQREVARDTFDIDSALKSVGREDANVIMIGEVDSGATFETILNLVETGHLVITTLLTRDATQTLERVLAMYPTEKREEIQERLAGNLSCLLVQDLVERADQLGQVAVFEVMFMNQSIKNIIRRGNLVQIRTAIQSSAEEGMITMDAFAYQLANQGIISQDVVNDYLRKEE